MIQLGIFCCLSLILIFSFGPWAMAETSNSVSISKTEESRDPAAVRGTPIEIDLKEEEEIKTRLSQKNYPGAFDQSDLKVQVQLIPPARKISPQAEETAEPSSND